MVASETDVSIEYDAAARLAYKDWCAKFGKDASDSKFKTFKANYETITVANVSAAKKARESGTDRPKDLELNEFGDMSEEEYLQMQARKSAPASAPEKGAMESVMEASMAQSDASNALAEAADALAEEEEVSVTFGTAKNNLNFHNSLYANFITLFTLKATRKSARFE
jgi:hypothetical protein